MADFRVDDHGAVGDGVVLDTSAIQAAIDAASAYGGGRVVLTAGRAYLSGSIVLASGVDLHLEGGSVLRASPDFGDFPVGTDGVVVMDEPPSEHSTVRCGVLVHAQDARDVAISGRGAIDGSGRHAVIEAGGPIHRVRANRVFPVYLRDVAGVRITDIRIEDSALWTLRLSRCDDVVVRGITIDNDLRMPNSDGIDIDACRRVRISDCDIRCGDDAICLKACIESTTDGRTCEDVVVTGCTLVSTSTAILCGVECATAIRNVVFSSCVVSASNRGLAVSLHERGTIENVTFSDMVVSTRVFDDGWWGHGEPVYVASVARSGRAGMVRGVTFSNIRARSERGAFVYAREPGVVRDVVLRDVTIAVERTGRLPVARADVRPAVGDGIFDDPVAGFRVENARDVLLDRCRVEWEVPAGDDYGPAVSTSAAPGFVVRELQSSSTEYGAVVNHDVPGRRSIR